MAKSSFRDRAIALAKKYLPHGMRDWVVRQQKRFHLQWPPAGVVRFGSFRRLTPISPIFALDRGFPIERYYIEDFLGKYSEDVKGRALELGDDFYICKFGKDKVTQTDILSYVEAPGVTIVADLTRAGHIPSDSFDCIIFTQSLQMIYDMNAALHTLHRILKPGGVLLLTSHGTSKIGRHLGRDDWGEYWHLTSQSLSRLMGESFPGADISIASYGNVLSAMCALHGLASEELRAEELDYQDRDYEVIVTARVVKQITT
ncbi:MAG TPA: methyltransferase domain-containing protein [Gammaproteobacteria bacterium]|nr:methyltransferase domain-containing protein [Gammaproteobacteria bacterium]